ncbi:5-formyltetrahydrofolate cyclo-ligase [Kocuria palustris]|uniref:5-formyltetrahydrofolate cyclo-ligase n=1 Tax=Kocuria palustris TaxID=71999 RepID=UPI0011A1E8B8|nr:5-formyltetrahydrofolate cyclo-ligase [Kocuria palustris]
MSRPDDDVRPSCPPRPDGAREAKRDLRRSLRDRRARADARARAAAAAGFAEALEQLLARHPDGALLAFLPLPDEPPLTSALRRQLSHRPVLLPVTQPRRAMLWTRWLPSTGFAPSGPGGLHEPVGPREPAPEEIGLVLVPALAVDRSGLRLGMGGGFYDTFLEGLRPGTPAAACVFAREVLPAGAVPGEPWDARLPIALTERGTVELRG